MQLIVLGMHRSGTSSVTRILNLAGAYFGAEGVSTALNDENPKGFWERRDVREVCDALLLGSGFDWWKVADFEPDRVPGELREEQVARFREIVLQLDAHRPWVMKEPRLCLTLPILRPVLEVPVFVHVVREPLEIAASLEARNNFPMAVGLALWERYTVSALAATRGEERVVVSYRELLDDPIATVTRLIGELEARGVQGLRQPTEREIRAFVTEDLYRQRRPPEDRAGYLSTQQASLARAIDNGRIFELSKKLVVSAGSTETLRAYEQTRTRIEELETSSAEAQAAAEAALLEAETTHAAVESSQRQELVTLRAETTAKIEELSAQVTAQASEIDAHRENIQRQARELEAASARGDALAARADQRREAVRRADNALRAAQHRVDGLGKARGFRIWSKLSGSRDRLRGRSGDGVRASLQGALKEIKQARSAIHSDLEGDSPAAAAAAKPLPIEELRLQRGVARARGDRVKVAVLAWDVGHNPLGRAHLLADLLRDQFDVELWGPQFDRYGGDIWSPLRETTIPIHRYEGSSFPGFSKAMEDAARRIDADVIYVSKPRLPSLGVGILAKELWNRPLVLDVDDFEPSFFEETEGLDIAQLDRLRGDPDLDLPFGRSWTRACEAVVTEVDQVTVSNAELLERYGGVIVPHARDERLFDPANHDRGAARARLGLKESDRFVLFGGTPRAHKGIVELVDAVERLGDKNVRVGVFDTRELDELRKRSRSFDRWIIPLPHQPFEKLPELLAAADLTCALQSPDHPVSRYQMPAKVTDAMAMGIPCLVTPVLPLQALIDKDIFEVFDGDIPLHQRLRMIFADPEGVADRARRAREVFLESYSYEAVRPIVAAAMECHLDDPPALSPALAALPLAVDRLVGGGTNRPAAPVRVTRHRRPIPPGSTYDLVMFWRQNDTGIYGRRQDMFLKYLARSGRFNTIVHFDHPMAVDELARIARRSIDGLDQNRMVLEQTARRLAHGSDRGAVRFRTFVYANGKTARALRMPRRSDYLDFVRSVLDKEGVGGGEGVGRRPVVFWLYPTSNFLPEVVDAFNPDIVVADVVDDNRTWYARDTPRFQQLERNYAEVLGRSDIVLANCQPVAETMSQFTDEVEVITNALELPDETPRGDRPSELDGLRGPIVGYAGNLSGRIDIELLRYLARARRDWNFVFLGSTHLDKSALHLASEPNVRLIGTKRYYHAQSIIRFFDVALIPHIDNEMTQSMNPLKAYVYCTLGIPIVSTPVANLGELAEFITVAQGPEEFMKAIDAALAAGTRVPDRDALMPHSWDVRVARALELVDNVAARRSDGEAEVA